MISSVLIGVVLFVLEYPFVNNSVSLNSILIPSRLIRNLLSKQILWTNDLLIKNQNFKVCFGHIFL